MILLARDDTSKMISVSSAETHRFHQSFGSTDLDASVLMIPIVGFLPPDDPRVRGTVAAIERELLVDGLALRYRTEGGVDGLPPGEGAFLPVQLLACRQLQAAEP